MNIIDGTDEIISAAINNLTGGREKFSSKTTAREVARYCSCNWNLLGLLEALWKQIEQNWKLAGYLGGGENNWRWSLRSNIDPENTSPETHLERGLAQVLPKKHYANQIPTASGLMGKNADRKRNIDLAHWDGLRTLTIVELKVATDTPLYAAFEIVRNALLLCLARTYEEKIKITEKDIWKGAKTAHLRVVAPSDFYQDGKKPFALGLFEKVLNSAISTFGKSHGLEMSFGFRVFNLTDALLTSIENALAYPS